ncbi:hypothetical protein JCM4814A_72660 [Streptomyces phaeofaciens JCM 4814]|uniref:Pyrrolo-quinoline quinone repeat domain-containing protein n=1 Tax=Streptomyces phaeofaciens TaxID=68254 RepID=A0A918HJ03_9ACTN|nr:PQQ-binding-like beta-propeller repeat protein [Streptomyces phaeofaciens]GGT62339.1 hypothetical protein GCM10010226_45120 [Streptomyces phaeofaciens]
MTQPPPNQPPQDQPPQQGAFGPPEPQDAVPQEGAGQDAATPQDAPPPAPQNTPAPPAGAPGFGAPQTPAAPPFAPPAAPPGGPQLSKTPEGGGPMPHQTGRPPQAPQAPPTPPQPGYGYPGQAPPTPPQPAYGYPQAGAPQPPQPPTTPGYGYPGQAPAPSPYAQSPQPPAPYGQPGAPYPPQQGYGYPGQPPTVPGYGYPGQPTVPLHAQGGPGTGGGGKKINAQAAIIVSAVVAIALIVGGGVWYANSGDGGKKDDTASTGGTDGGGDDKGDTGGTTSTGGKEKAPADTSAKILFQLPMPVVKKDDSVGVRGSWMTDKAYVKTGVNEVVGYDLDKGTKLWTVKLPGPVCEASRFATDDYRTAVVFQASTADTASCDQVAAIDLAAGKQLWKKTVASGDYPVDFDNVTVSANTVALGGTDGGAAFDIDSGKALWAPKATDTCYDAGYGGGPKLVAVRKCGGFDDPQLNIQTIDPASGKVISEYKMTKGIEYASVVSTEPLVVAADVGDSAGDGSGISDFFSIDNKTGKLRTRISVPGDDFAADCEGITKIEQCSGLAVGNGRIYVPTEEHEGTAEYSRTNEIVAFDLATGKQTGQRADAGDEYTIYPLRMDGSSLIAYKRPPYDKGGQIVSIDGGSFKETKLLENPSTEASVDAETSMLPEYSEILYSQGHMYMSQVYASESSSDDPEYLALAFGTSG